MLQSVIVDLGVAVGVMPRIEMLLPCTSELPTLSELIEMAGTPGIIL
jgi:hypothetical protein